MTYNPHDFWQGRGQRWLERDYQLAQNHPARQKFRTIGPIINPKGTVIGPELAHLAGAIKYHCPVNILDVGSGWGAIYQYLFQNGLRGLDYTACDIADAWIEAHHDTTGIRPIKWDGKTLPFEENQFEFVIAYAVLLHVPSQDIEHFLSELVRVSSRWLYVHTAAQMKNPEAHGFNHYYWSLFEFFGIQINNELKSLDGKRINWLLEVP